MPRKFRKKKSVARDSHLLRAAALLMKSQHAFSSHAHVQPSFPHFLDENVSRFYDLKGTTTQQQQQQQQKKEKRTKNHHHHLEWKRLKVTQTGARARSLDSICNLCVCCVSSSPRFVLFYRRSEWEMSRVDGMIDDHFLLLFCFVSFHLFNIQHTDRPP